MIFSSSHNDLPDDFFGRVDVLGAAVLVGVEAELEVVAVPVSRQRTTAPGQTCREIEKWIDRKIE